MLLDKCLVSSDLSPGYLEYWPIVYRNWRNIVGIEANLVLIADEIPKFLLKYRPSIHLISPVEGIPTAFQAKCIRLLYPALIDTSGAVIISDIDMIPMNKTYYISSISNVGDEKFVVYRDPLSHLNQYPICYNAALPRVWREIFHIESKADIANLLIKWYHETENPISPFYGKTGGFDQMILFRYLNEWHQATGNLIKLCDSLTGCKRLDRSTPKILKLDRSMITNIIQHEYTDFHMLRPYHRYKKQIRFIENLLAGDIYTSQPRNTYLRYRNYIRSFLKKVRA